MLSAAPAAAALELDSAAAVSCEKRWLPSRTTGSAPAPRCSHTATPLSAQKFLVVGGGSCDTDGRWTHYGDVHEFDASTRTWTELLPAEGSPALPPRRGHCAGVYPEQDALFVFGGTSGGTGHRELMNDFWKFHLTTRVWSRIPSTAATPGGRRGGMSALSAARGEMFVFGGYVGVYPGFDPEMYRCNLKTGEWVKVESHGSPPLLALASCTLVESDDGRSDGATAALLPSHQQQLQLVVFGGSCCDLKNPRTDLSNALWVCDLISGRGGVTWSRLATDGIPPTPRFSHGCAAIHNCIVVFGGTGRRSTEEEEGEGEGEDATVTYADTHILDMRRPVPLWKEAPELDSSTAPSERNGFTLVPCGADFVRENGLCFLFQMWTFQMKNNHWIAKTGSGQAPENLTKTFRCFVLCSAGAIWWRCLRRGLLQRCPRLPALAAAKGTDTAAAMLRHFKLKRINLPRQARDRHRKSSQKRVAVSIGLDTADHAASKRRLGSRRLAAGGDVGRLPSKG